MISSAQSIKLKLRYFNVLGQKKIFQRDPVNLDILKILSLSTGYYHIFNIPSVAGAVLQSPP